MSKPWRIVKIIDSYRIVVNAGRDDFIEEGQALEVYVTGQTVIDPETGENLGALDLVKAKLRVLDVFPKMCICENWVLERVASLGDAISPLFDSALPLNVDAKEISGGFEGVSKELRIGDFVRKRD